MAVSLRKAQFHLILLIIHRNDCIPATLPSRTCNTDLCLPAGANIDDPEVRGHQHEVHRLKIASRVPFFSFAEGDRQHCDHGRKKYIIKR